MQCLAVATGPVSAVRVARPRVDVGVSRARAGARGAGVRLAASAGTTPRDAFSTSRPIRPRSRELTPRPLVPAIPSPVSNPADDAKNGSLTSAAPPSDASAATTVDTAAETTAETTASSPSRRPEKKFITGRPDEQYSSAAAEERQELFNDIAPVYDQLNDVLSLGLHRVWKRAAVKWTGVKKGDRAIDVCCGSGDLTLRLADAVGPTGEVVGLDFAAAQLKVAATKETEHPAGYNLSPISWQQGDALALPHPDASFDGATIGYGLRNVSDIPRALAELRRVLKPGGKAAVVDFNNSTNAAVNQVQGFLLDTVVVPAADAMGVAAEYRYLKPSIERYPTGPELVDIAIAAGFGKATFYELAPGGLMGCLVCEK